MECRECSSGVSPSLRLPECTDWFAGISDLMSIIAHRQSDLLPGNETLDEIEAAVEEFKLKALPELESDLLKVAQMQLSEQVKKTDLGSRTVKL